MQFPADSYTPHGYLDTPTHTRNLSPRGVLRSHDAGFRWHFPAHAGMYGGRRETYRAGFRLAIDGALALADFDRASSPYHSKNLFAFDLARGPASGLATYHLVGEHALRASLELQGAARLTVHAEYTRLLAANGEWGESGLVGRVEDGCLVMQGFEGGDAFVLWTSRQPSDLGIAVDPAVAAAWAVSKAPGTPGEGFVPVLGRPGEAVSLYGVLGFALQPGSSSLDPRELKELRERIDVILARGKTVAEARQHLELARRTAEVAHMYLLAEDDAFWSHAPQLTGHWPERWRRGLVYDLETLRMMVKQPLGIYQHIWDAMQIHAPRVVLAETAIDALLLAYADPELAQELMLGAFLDAPAPNVPCSREDGSYNMVAADGTVCGTSPSWGYPWLVLAWLYELRPDDAWLAQLYPRLAEHLDWWLSRRRDESGWLVYASSWESGQDDSPRFGPQPLGGGHPIRHVRPVDLQAAFAHACRVMVSFAASLDRTHDRAKWTALADEFTARTSQLWVEARPTTDDQGESVVRDPWSVAEDHGQRTTDNGQPRYADFDTHTGAFTGIDDVMLLAPAALGVAPDKRVSRLRQAIAAIDPNTLTWPMFAWTAVEAATQAGMHDKAAELAAAICERAYGFWDAREAKPGHTLPGVSCEYWPTSGRCGGEGYGWGAFTTHLLLHTLIGITPTRESLQIRPNLPPEWRTPGRRYSVSLHWHGRALLIALEPLGDGRVAVTVNHHREEVGWGEVVICPWGSILTML